MKRWPQNNAWIWETAPFLRILLPFVSGIVIYELSLRHWLSYPLLIFSVTAIFFSLVTIRNKVAGIYSGVAFVAMMITLLAGGYTLSYFNDVRNDKAWFGRHIDHGTTYMARINDEPAGKEHTWKIPVTIFRMINADNATTVHGKAFLYLYKDHDAMLLHKGDTVFTPGNWQPIRNAGNPFEFDYARYCRLNNILYQQFCSVRDIRLFSANDPDGAPLTERIHSWCMNKIETYVPDPKTGGLVQAMLLGDEVNLDEDLRQSYAETGIVHIIAISGGNVAIFFIVISFLLRWVRNKKHLWIKYLVALPLVWFYVMMAGAAPSAIRAAMMFSLLAAGIAFQKNNNSLNQLFATAFVLLCAQPMWLFSIGFQLSFIAVLSLILFYAPVYRLLSLKYKITRMLWSTVAASIAAEVLVAPVVIYYFHNFPLFFIVANVAAYIFMSIVLIVSIALIILSFIPIVATAIGLGTMWLVTIFDNIVSWLQHLSPVRMQTLVLTGPELVLAYVLVSGIALFLTRKKKAALFASLASCCLLIALSSLDAWVSLRQQKFIVYNTGNISQIELVNGNSYSVVRSDTGVGKRTAYATSPAHIYWHTLKKETETKLEFLRVNGRRILVSGRITNGAALFPVDYLVLNDRFLPDAEDIKKNYSPKLVIIGNGVSGRRRDKMIKDYKTAGLAIHDVKEMGAFVLE